jgi:hypothetical protein
MSKSLLERKEANCAEAFWVDDKEEDDEMRLTPGSSNTGSTDKVKSEMVGAIHYDEYYEDNTGKILFEQPEVSHGCLDIADWNDIFNISSNYLNLNNDENLDIPNYFAMLQQEKQY